MTSAIRSIAFAVSVARSLSNGLTPIGKIYFATIFTGGSLGGYSAVQEVNRKFTLPADAKLSQKISLFALKTTVFGVGVYLGAMFSPIYVPLKIQSLYSGKDI